MICLRIILNGKDDNICLILMIANSIFELILAFVLFWLSMPTFVLCLYKLHSHKGLNIQQVNFLGEILLISIKIFHTLAWWASCVTMDMCRIQVTLERAMSTSLIFLELLLNCLVGQCLSSFPNLEGGGHAWYSLRHRELLELCMDSYHPNGP